jgi:hypothetical protein
LIWMLKRIVIQRTIYHSIHPINDVVRIQECHKTCRRKGKGKGKGLPVTDIVSAEQDMAMELDDEEESEQDAEVEEDDEEEVEEERPSKKSKDSKGKQVAVVEKGKPRKDKVLLLSSRNTTGRMRHFMLDLQALLPHTKKGESFVVAGLSIPVDRPFRRQTG